MWAQTQTTTSVTNVFQDHYAYRYTFGSNNCPNGYSIDSSQYASTPTYGALHLERGHAIHHIDPKTPANDYWVYWVHLDSSNYGLAEAAVFKSTTECGPYVLQSQAGNPYSVDGSGYGFRPGGWEFRDDNIFRDAPTQTYNSDGSVSSYASSYVMAASNDLGTQRSGSSSTCNYANDSLAVFRMTPDYLGIDATTNVSTNGANWVFVCDQREAPVMFRKGSKYFLITSQAAGWYPSQGGYGVSSNPLTGWTTDPIALGNTSTFGQQTSDGVTVQGTNDTTYILVFDHLGGSDSKNPALAYEGYDTGETYLPVTLDETAGTATLQWAPAFSVNNVTGVLTLPGLTNLALGATATSTVASATTYVPGNAIDGSYATRWAGSASGNSSFNAASPTGTALCPVTGATTSTTCNPSLIVDLGSVQPVQQIDLSFYMIKGSEPYYTYKVAYSNDRVTWSTLDFTSFAPGSRSSGMNLSAVPFNVNNTYGFNSLLVNFNARYVAVSETSVVQQNSSSSFYSPGLYEMAVYKSTAPFTPQSVTVAVTSTNANPSPSVSFNVGVTVSGPMGQSTPTGYVQLSAPGYTSETYGLINGATTFTVPAGALTGSGTITASFRPDAMSVPIYGLNTSTGTINESLTPPDPPAGVTVTAAYPGALTAAWSAASGATSYAVARSSDGGATFAPIGTTTSLSYTDTGLTNGKNYCYEIASANSSGAGSFSGASCLTATADFPVTGVLLTQSGNGALTISYKALANATGYAIQRSVNGGAYSNLASAASTAFTDTGLATDGTSYCYTVAAAFPSGTGSASAPVCSTATSNIVQPFTSGGAYIFANVNSALLLDVQSASTASGAATVQYQNNNKSDQRWLVTASGSSWVITNVNSGLALDVVSTSAGSSVIQKTVNGGLSQLWNAVAVGDGSFKIVNASTSLLLDVSGSSTANSGTIDQWIDNGGKNQHWYLAQISSGLVSGQTYVLPNVNSTYVIDVGGGSTSAGAAIDQWYANNGTNQRWVATASGPSWVLTSVNSGLALDVSSATKGSSVIQNTVNGSATQNWNTVAVGDGSFKLVNASTGYLVDVGGGSTTAGAAIDQWSDTGGSNQHWFFQRLVSIPTMPAIVWATPAAISYGTALSGTQLNAAATVNGKAVAGTYTYLPAAGTVPNAGNQNLSVTFTPTDTVHYASVTSSLALQVNPASLTVAASSQSMFAGDAVPALTATFSGFVNGDTASVLTGTPLLQTTATSSSVAGPYPITVTQGSLSSGNYTFVFSNGTLTVIAPASITLNTSSTLSAVTGGYQAVVTVQNTGSTKASNVQLTNLTLGAASAGSLPIALGDLAPGASAKVTVAVPASAGARGATVVERINGTYTGGSFGATIRARLP